MSLLQDPLDDEIQYLFIMSLIRQNHFDLAKEQYHKASRLLYERLGIKQSHYLQKAYMEVMKNNNHIIRFGYYSNKHCRKGDRTGILL